ncbi:DegT/DnrJ/EryC1/StrS family aminotransferase [Paenibacillus taichungensis]|uniref:DegT/DnrJ/EryC1/StrS family aminotransferase n=1 Tax=Paenibacillus taichungensis TaxID=484184 RepID=UPI003D9AA62E
MTWSMLDTNITEIPLWLELVLYSLNIWIKIAYRKQLARWYDEGFHGHTNIKSIKVAPGCDSSRHLYVIEVDKRDELLLALNESEIYPGVHYRDNTEYRMYSYAKGTCPNSHHISERILSLPMHLRMQKSDVDKVVEHVLKFTSM